MRLSTTCLSFWKRWQCDLAVAGDRGLGFWSEQAMESAHRDFSDTWSQGFKVDLMHPEYAQRLLRCVTVYCSRHL